MEIGNILKSAEGILKGVGGWTQDAINRFEILSNIKEVFQEVQKFPSDDRIIENLCYSVVCGGFILLECCFANLSKTIREMEKEELPKRLQPKVKEIRSYFASMEKKLQELADTVKAIRTTIRESRPRNYKLTQEEKFELKMLMRDFKTDLKIAENYQKEADRALKSLQSELRDYLIKEGVLATGASVMIGAAAGAAASAAGEYLKASLTQQAVTTAALEDAAALGATVGALIGAVKQVYSINSKYETCKTEINSLQTDLNILRNKIKEMYPMLDNLSETLGDLNVV